MGLEKVKEDILGKARKKAEKIVEEGKKEADAIKDRAKAEVLESRRKSKADALKVCEVMEKKELSAAEFDAKKTYLDAKKKMVDKVFDSAIRRLAEMDKSEKKGLLKGFIERASKEMEIGKVYAGKDDLKLIDKYPTEEKALQGGVIVENKDGNVRLDLTFETMLSDIREKKIQHIAKILFD